MFGKDPAWLTVENEPVLFVYSRALTQGLLGQGISIWDEILQKVETTHPVYISGDADMTFLWGIVPKEFDQIHLYNPTFQSHLFGKWTLDYKGLCKIGHNRGQSCALPVIPGYDDSALPSRNEIIINRDNGNVYKLFWEKAKHGGADWILITSFNEWHEGTEIEPSMEYGNFYLNATAIHSKSFKLEVNP